jgi:hypothetical protein
MLAYWRTCVLTYRRMRHAIAVTNRDNFIAATVLTADG